MLDKKMRIVEITDDLLCRGEHTAESCWHFAEACDVSLEPDGSVLAVNEERKIRLIPGGRDVEVDLRRGKTGPIGGWVSRQFDVKSETTTVVWRSAISGDTQLRTRIEILD
jgi:hypothetical protein